MATRLIGQDTVVTLIADNVPLVTIDTIKSCDITIQTEILKEGFLGQTTDLRDEVFKGIAGKIEAQMSGKELLDLASAVMNRAKNRSSGVRVTVKSTFQFPGGDRALFVIPDVKFGNIPISNKGRTEYVDISLDFEADDMTFISR